MNLNWYAAEILMKQQQVKMERTSRGAWKWLKIKQEKLVNKTPYLIGSESLCCVFNNGKQVCGNHC